MEQLEVKNLGPLREARLSPRQLSILIGPQASGKSLLIQLLYLLRDLVGHLARRPLDVQPIQGETREMRLLRDLFGELRGVPFGYFANGTMQAVYHPQDATRGWKLKVFKTNRWVRPYGALEALLQNTMDDWSRDPSLAGAYRGTRHQHFLPTERAAFTRLVNSDPAVLYAPYQPLPFREFARDLSESLPLFREIVHGRPRAPFHELMLTTQARTLQGEAYVPRHGPKLWKWRVPGSGKERLIPIEATSSGQSEAWPFFVIATVMGARPAQEFYLEEPETHLHPEAQVGIVDAIEALLRQGHSVSLTTHSPFLLMAINNRLQRFQVTGGTEGIDPQQTCSWRLGGGGIEDVMDRAVGLMDLDELEQVAERLGLEFDRLLEAE